jgi:hypothetical protein
MLKIEMSEGEGIFFSEFFGCLPPPPKLLKWKKIKIKIPQINYYLIGVHPTGPTA